MCDLSNGNNSERLKATVYIVDRDPNALDAIVQLLEPTGLSVETFLRGNDFLYRYREEGPGCLIANMWLPDMSGRKLQSILAEKGYEIPLIFVAERADVRMAVEALKAGAANFFEKPFRDHELYDEIQLAISARAERWRRREVEQTVEKRLNRLKHGQRKVVELAIEGYTNNEIAQMLCLSVRGVEHRRSTAMKILGVKSKGDLLKLLKNAKLNASRKVLAISYSCPSGDKRSEFDMIDDGENIFKGEKHVYLDLLDSAACGVSDGERSLATCTST